MLLADDLYIQGNGTIGPSDDTGLLLGLSASANSGMHVLNPPEASVCSREAWAS